ncbi:unnamed protein product [Blepharisma stoltei]|uniref:Uncharacterized protein n=1 Tax=Blepharisma stoltei TaxID=1481888 RepID=A0AAU9IDM0_9CILI|nr:unnamed protein product [Blepharisma stoltei]
MKTNQDFFSLHFCLLGTAQLSLIYGKAELLKEVPYVFILSPSLCYLLIEIILAIIEIINSEEVTQSEALKILIKFATLGLAFTSIIFLIESMDSGFESLVPILLPLFLILAMHSSCRVLHKPPPIISSILNILPPTLSVCTINGTCSSMYVSLFSSVFSAFGASISDFITILNPLTYLLLFLTILSLFFSKHSIKHPPFLLGLFSTVGILLFQYLDLFMMILMSNGLLMVSVLWNNQMIKVGEFKRI